MEDFYYAGGLPVVIKTLGDSLDGSCITVSGHTLAENVQHAENFNLDVIKTWDEPVKKNVPIAILRGNLCPNGAVLKEAAASPELLQHTGKAHVFETIEDMKENIDSPDLPVDATTLLVLKNCGPKGYPGMPEVGDMPVPLKLLEQGINDIVRISDARMSGTAYGTVVLHVAPEAAAGGPLALVETGDTITLDVPNRSLHLHVSDEELALRKACKQEQSLGITRGYAHLYIKHVQQADLGADFDFLVGGSGDEVTRESH